MTDINIARAFVFIEKASDFIGECSHVLGQYFGNKAMLEAAQDSDNQEDDNEG